MSNQIDDSLHRMEGLRTFLLERSEHTLQYKSKLKEICKSPLEFRSLQVSQDVVDRARSAWKVYVTTGDDSGLSSRFLRVLCAQASFAWGKPFLSYLSQANRELSSGAVRSLVNNYHKHWSDRVNFPHLETFIEEQLRFYKGRNYFLCLWRDNAKHVVGADAPNNIAYAVARECGDVQAYFAKLELGTCETSFGLAVYLSIAALISNMFEFADVFPSNIWDYFCQHVLEYGGFDKSSREAVLARVIGAIDRHRQDSGWQSAQEFLKDYLLRHAEFGDPRVNPAKWYSFDRKAREIFISWLSEEDIAFFFEFLIENDPHGRKHFWLQYVRAIKDSLVIIGKSHRRKHAMSLRELQKKGRRFARGVGSIDSSAFILNFGRYVVVEFSEVKNACYLYESRIFEKMFEVIRASDIDLNDLKNKALANSTQSHFSNWSLSLSQRLSELGIMADR